MAVKLPTRPNDVPAPPVHAIRALRPEMAQEIMTAARRLGREPTEFLADLVWIGWQARQAQGKN